MTHPMHAPTFTGEPGDTYQPEQCCHSKDEGCEYCCHKCNFGTHTCKACGTSVAHEEVACVECRAFEANERAVAEMTETP